MSKYTLYSSPFCPFSRKVMFFLDERSIDYELTDIKYWLRSKDFLKLNPASETPVLKNLQTKEVICDSFLICNYIDEIESKTGELGYFNFLGNNLEEKYEIQRLHMWFDKKFYNEVSKHFIEETFLNSVKENRDINMDRINIASINLEKHITYIEYLLSKRKWLASELFSIADIAASTQLSVLDYTGYINWDKNQKLKEWYMTIKSKQGFKKLLYYTIPGFKASKYYSELDF
ncbi:MAG: glutathione S-transferase family protein [Rickettsiales bacterium]|nr:glutathione S-transferase family protein [Rickettsiales bacterium]